MREKQINGKKLGEFLLKKRKEIGLGRKKAAELIGIDKKTIYHLENAVYLPKLEPILKMSIAYGFDLDELIDTLE